MKKTIIVFISLIILIIFSNCNIIKAEETNEINTSTIIDSQSKSLDISSFLDETKKYSTDVLDGIDVSKMLSEAITGKIDNLQLGKNILKKFLNVSLSGLATISSIIIIIIIHSLLKNISEGLENESVSQITYFVTYILIVAIVMKSFSEIIGTVKISIESLVGFINCLLPILMTLVVATRKYYIGNNATTNTDICDYFYR